MGAAVHMEWAFMTQGLLQMFLTFQRVFNTWLAETNQQQQPFYSSRLQVDLMGVNSE